MRGLRSLFFVVTVIVSCLSCAAVISAQGSAQDPGLRLGEAPDQEAGQVTVLLSEGATAGTRQLFLIYRGSELVPDVQLFANLTDQKKQPLTSGRVQFFDGDGSTPLGTFTLTSTLRSRLITLEARDFTQTGDFTGPIYARVGSNAYKVADLSVSRPPTTSVSVLEAGAGREFTLQSYGLDLNSTFQVEGAGGEASTSTIALALSPLTSTNGSGQTMMAVLSPTVIPLTRQFSQSVTVTGTVPEVGLFQGRLTLTYGDKIDTYRLLVRREAGTPHLEVSAESPQTVHRAFPLWGGDAEVPITISETVGSRVKLYPPQLGKLVQFVTGGEGPSAQLQAAFQGPDRKPLTNEITELGAGEQRKMTLILTDIRSLGQYQGTLRVATPGGPASQATFNLVVKDGFMLPAFVIALGVFASYLVRRWLQIGRPQAVRQAAIRDWLDIIGQEGTIDSRLEMHGCIRGAFTRVLNRAYNDSLLEPGADVTSQLQKLGEQLKNYGRIQPLLLWRVDGGSVGGSGSGGGGGKSTLQRLIPNGDEHNQIARDIRQLENDVCLAAPDGLSNPAEGKNSLIARAEAIQERIEQQAHKDLGDALAGLRAELEEDLKAEKDFAIQRELSALRSRVDAVRSRVGLASNVVVDLARLPAARDDYNAIMQDYLRLNVRRFRDRLEKGPVPPGFNDNSWRTFKREVAAKLPPNPTSEEYVEARKFYITSLVKRLQEYAKDLLKSDDANLAALKDRLREIAKEEVTLDDPDAVQVQYNNLLDKFRPVERALDPDSGNEAPAFDAPATPALLMGAPRRLPAYSPPGAAEITVPSMGSILAKVRRNDTIATVILGLLTVALGLVSLWAGNNTFGSLADYINALLWGFGFSQLNMVPLDARHRDLAMPFYPKTEQKGE